MAFKPAESKAKSTSNERDTRTTIGFVNLYITLEDGSKVKVAGDLGIRMYAENPTHQDYIDAVIEHGLDAETAGQGITVEVVPYTQPDPDAPRSKPAFFAGK